MGGFRARFQVVAALSLGLGTTVSAAGAAAPPARAHAPPSDEPLPFIDTRDGAGEAIPPGGDATARRELSRSLGRQGIVDVDPLTGTPRAVGRRDGALAGPRAGDPERVAMDYVRAHAAALGLDDADLRHLSPAQPTTSPGGITHMRWRQAFEGIPAYDNELRVDVAADGRVLDVRGSPRHALAADSTAPALSASQALRALMLDVGVTRAASVARGPAGPRRTTTFSTADTADLVLFGVAPRVARLAWHVSYRATSRAWYDAVVDAETGRVLRRANLVRSEVPALVWESYPGAAIGGTAQHTDLTAYLAAPFTTRLSGPFAHVWSDLNDNNAVDSGEEIPPSETKTRAYPFTDFTPINFGGGCLLIAQCSWDHRSARSWERNRRQNAVQVFYLVNRFHDHLAAPPIGFTAASGGFEVDDPLFVHTDDGADTAAGLPDPNHSDNANMATPADGRSPIMQLYLFAHDDGSPFRDVNAGDDAITVYHEYTHGLSSRLITDAQGVQALNSAQSAAMAEGWSDWYAQDFLVARLPGIDTGADGEVRVGRYGDATPNKTRTEPLDCPVGSASPACPGAPGAGPGGYSYGDLGRIAGRPEVHADGEIWAQTLWDLRGAVGSQAAERLVTEGMRLSPPEPSFLDMRNAILQADAADPAHPGQLQDAIWSVFARRGMGFYAAAADGGDVAPAEDFSVPPARDAPRGSIVGRVTNGETGLPLWGATIGVAGQPAGALSGAPFGAQSGQDGAYRLDGVPAGTYPKLLFAAPGYDRMTRGVVEVTPGGTVTADAALRRDWASTAGGASVVATNGDEYSGIGCGPGAILDQSPSRGWSANNPSPARDAEVEADKSVTIQLPTTIDVTGFGMDPGNACGDGPSAATKAFKVETSTDGTSFTVAAGGEFAPADAHRLNPITPAAGATSARFVRLTLISAQNELPGFSGNRFIDFAEFEVFGGPPNTLPSGTLAASPSTVAAGGTVHLDATSMRDPDSVITAYGWDFDGDGAIDQTTDGALVDRVYPNPGTYTPRVLAHDIRGGAGEASARVIVTQAPAGGRAPSRSVAGRRRAAAVVIEHTGRRGRIVVRIRCRSRCRVGARLVVGPRTARRLRLGRARTIGATRLTLARGGSRTIRIAVRPSARRALRRAGRVRATAVVTIVLVRARHPWTTRRAVTIRP